MIRRCSALIQNYCDEIISEVYDFFEWETIFNLPNYPFPSDVVKYLNTSWSSPEFLQNTLTSGNYVGVPTKPADCRKKSEYMTAVGEIPANFCNKSKIHRILRKFKCFQMTRNTQQLEYATAQNVSIL